MLAMFAIPTVSIIFMFLSGLISIIVPIVLAIYLFRKKKQKISTLLIGAATFVVFALILEATINKLVLSNSSPFGQDILHNIWLYGAYAGLAAGIFEEVGRFIAFKLILKKATNPDDSLMYGVGHGGIEAIILVGLQLTIIGVYAVIFNSNPGSGALSQDILDTLEPLSSSPAIYNLIAGIERMIAITLQIALSVIVFVGVKNKGKNHLIFIAILIHAFVDFMAVILMEFTNVYLTEAVILILTLVTVFFAYRLYKEMKSKMIVLKTVEDKSSPMNIEQ